METTSLETKVNRIFDFDKSIWCVVLLSSDGKSLANFCKAGVAPLEPQDETETVYMRATIAMNMSSPMDKYHGRIRTAIIVKEKVVMICFSLSQKIMLISATPEFQLRDVEALGQLIDQLGMG